MNERRNIFKLRTYYYDNMELKYVPFDSRKNLQWNIVGLMIYFAVVFLLTLLVVFGTDIARTQNSFFGIPSVFFGMLLFFLLGVFGVIWVVVDKFLLKKVDMSLLHDPEKGVLSKVPDRGFQRFICNPVILIFLLVIILSPLYYFQNIIQNSPIGAPEYSVLDDAGKVFYAGEPTVFGEGIGLQMVLWGASFAFVKWLSRGNSFLLYGILFLFTFVDTAFMTVYHLLRYAGQDPALIAVTFFFWTTFLLAWAFGSVIVFIIPHNITNWLWGAKSILSTDVIFYTAIGIYAVCILFFALYIAYFFSQKHRSVG